LLPNHPNPTPRHGRPGGRGSFLGRTGDTLFGRVGLVSLGLLGTFVVLAFALVAHVGTQGWPAVGRGSGAVGEVLDLGTGPPDAGQPGPPDNPTAPLAGLSATAGPTTAAGLGGEGRGANDRLNSVGNAKSDSGPRGGANGPTPAPVGGNTGVPGAGGVETVPQPVTTPQPTPSSEPGGAPQDPQPATSPVDTAPASNPADDTKPPKPSKPKPSKPSKPGKPPKGNSSTAQATSGSAPAVPAETGSGKVKGKAKKSK
jgi:hypothetical protein